MDQYCFSSYFFSLRTRSFSPCSFLKVSFLPPFRNSQEALSVKSCLSSGSLSLGQGLQVFAQKESTFMERALPRVQVPGLQWQSWKLIVSCEKMTSSPLNVSSPRELQVITNCLFAKGLRIVSSDNCSWKARTTSRDTQIAFINLLNYYLYTTNISSSIKTSQKRFQSHYQGFEVEQIRADEANSTNYFKKNGVRQSGKVFPCYLNIFNQRMSEQEWEYIPQQAFLYFPTGEDVKSGSEEKQWRKIFEGGIEYEPFEEAALGKLDAKLQEKSAIIHGWFDRPNRLRFLQANKFKTSNTLDSMLETTKWRNAEFPIKVDPATSKMLNSGAFYFSGRDDKYRPIMVADIGKFDADDVETIPKVLAIVMEFLIGELLVEGQVENYILVMNLEEANFGLRNVIMKILSFTSNAYRGRLFASYILAMPTIIRWGWEGIISKFVSENTLKKIKITGEKVHEDMWTHISKDTIEQQYGGNMPNVQPPFWPPNKHLLRFVNITKQPQNNLISPEKYLSLFNDGKLTGRKVLKSLVWKEPVKTETKPPKIASELPVETPKKEAAEKDHSEMQQLPRSQLVSKASLVNIDLEETKTQILIQTETSFIKDYLTIKTFFKTPQFLKICKVAGQ